MPNLLTIALACAVMRSSIGVELDLSNWMGQLEPVVEDATLLDLSMPGSHDTMTYDLSDAVAEGYEGLGPVVSKILHTVTPVVAGRFIREQGQTQGLDIVAQLNAGVRFIDFRIMYTDTPDKLFSHKDWYNLHGCQSKSPALEYLKNVHTWLEAHPKEVLVFWVSRHGNSDPTGTDQYPATTPAERQKFFESVQTLFGSMMHNATLGALKDTPMNELWKRGTQVIWYAADYKESTASSPLAIDAVHVDNQLPGVGYGYGSIGLFRSGKAHRESMKAQDKFFLMSLAGSDSCTIEYRAFLTYLPIIEKDSNTKKCAQCYKLPGMTDSCPMSLQETGQINNYYNQIVLEGAFNEGENNTAVDFPNAIYIDGLDADGKIRTGTDRLNPKMLGSNTDPQTAGYGYSATVIAATVRRLCRASTAVGCKDLTDAVNSARAKHPVQTWDDAAHGRLASPPPLPSGDSNVLVI
eukprot:TRINITY_DN101295_c0_g1_i1.p1 TRINITY_DN101295_c0_g1~~TRINITY_DN101295_c0_g1_i1.p1  ORF type:complete len:465 (+),score=47.19 TRINITY_DN101295_c0_g1_i1:111-1505(+)